MIATAPGKLILAGEYAVLRGATAIVAATSRRVIARAAATPQALSPFLAAAADQIAQARGPDGPAARAARAIVVDSTALYDGDTKLGLGSSAAATVAAVACALAHEEPPPSHDEIHAIARAAHADAQGARGARGSGADIAASTYGGVIAFHAGAAAVRQLALPADLVLLPFWTGAPADTATLVARITSTRGDATDELLDEIAIAALRLAAATTAADAIAAIDLGSRAIDALGRAAGLDLLTDVVRRARGPITALGGAAKTTGAGGGDVAIAALPAGASKDAAIAAILDAGGRPLGISVGGTGVDIVRPPE